MTSELPMLEDDRQIVLPLHAEEVLMAKRRTSTGRTQISITTRQQEDVVEELLAHERVEIERTPIGRPVEHAPAIRAEGDTVIIPVVEEVLVIERRLVLKEEVRVRRVRETENHQERVKIRKQEAVITHSAGRNNKQPSNSRRLESKRK